MADVFEYTFTSTLTSWRQQSLNNLHMLVQHIQQVTFNGHEILIILDIGLTSSILPLLQRSQQKPNNNLHIILHNLCIRLTTGNLSYYWVNYTHENQVELVGAWLVWFTDIVKQWLWVDKAVLVSKYSPA